jgi:hypothetical protein
MDPVLAFFLGLAILLGASIVVLVFVRRQLHRILVELCAGEHRAAFWDRLFEALLVVGVLFCALLFPPKARGAADTVGVFEVLGMLRAGLFGLFTALAMLAVVTWAAVASFDRRSRRRRGPEDPLSLGS